MTLLYITLGIIAFYVLCAVLVCAEEGMFRSFYIPHDFGLRAGMVIVVLSVLGLVIYGLFFGPSFTGPKRGSGECIRQWDGRSNPIICD